MEKDLEAGSQPSAAPHQLRASFTPGPWDFCGLNKRWGIYPASAVNDGIDYFIAATRQISNPDAEKANARLIAAAPDLLDALRWFIDDIDNKHTAMRDFDAAVARARAALSKAGA